ncbi:MAG: pyruvate kinase [Microbacteriaceae bacterium]|nr:pyruvate kinase [Microbacteriaceae bacterium]
MSLPELSLELHRLRDDLFRAETLASPLINAVQPQHRRSARNLVHYVAARQHDLRPLQASLASYGLSSLGRMEAIVLPWIETVIETVNALAEGRGRHPIWGPLDTGEHLLMRNRDDVLGTVHGSDARSTRIMVTMPSEAADEPGLVERMGAAGMDIARINCAHDSEIEWARMVASVRGLPGGVRVAMDLGGPKLRTGPLAEGPRVVRVRPERDDRGEVVVRARVRLVDEAAAAPGEGEPVVVPVRGLEGLELREGDRLKLRDARGRKRELVIERVAAEEVEASFDRTVYFETGAELVAGVHGRLVVGELPEVRQHLFVRAGDEVRLQRDMSPQPATQTGPHRIGCSLEAAFADVRPGHRVLFDDGKIAGRVRTATHDEIVVDVERAGVEGVKLRAEKGINLPDTTLRIPALTEADRSHLPFVAANADTVNLSFVRSPDDVADLIRELEALGQHDIGITLKIETGPAFEALPQMLLEAMRWGEVGVMIARGDLAVELGFERLAEVQEEILWVCEAAHVPVIWATQVLDTLARTGLPSRAEVTDAAMGRRAEAVMLNKGPFIVEAIEALESILDRMGGHVEKKRSLLRPLASFDLRTPDL